MGMRAPVTGNGDYKERELPPAGNYLAVCNGVYMLGTQPGYEGQDAKMQVMLSFELHKRKGPARDSENRVMEATRIMSFTTNIKSTLVEYAGALRGQPYSEDEVKGLARTGGIDPEDFLGKPCSLTIVHKKNLKGVVKDQIKSISSIDPEDDVPPTPETDEVYWDWTMGAECPRRIEYFWKRAAENPNKEYDADAYSQPIKRDDAATVAAVVGDDETPF